MMSLDRSSINIPLPARPGLLLTGRPAPRHHVHTHELFGAAFVPEQLRGAAPKRVRCDQARQGLLSSSHTLRRGRGSPPVSSPAVFERHGRPRSFRRCFSDMRVQEALVAAQTHHLPQIPLQNIFIARTQMPIPARNEAIRAKIQFAFVGAEILSRTRKRLRLRRGRQHRVLQIAHGSFQTFIYLLLLAVLVRIPRPGVQLGARVLRRRHGLRELEHYATCNMQHPTCNWMQCAGCGMQ